MKTISVTGGKGGTGKSTIAASLAAVMSGRRKVLLVDADADCPNDHLILSANRKKLRDIYQTVPAWDFSRCTKCGKCAAVCKQNAIVAVKGKYPAFVPELCTGCGACMAVCPSDAIEKGKKKIGTVFTGSGFGVDLVSGELKLGELASGEVVVETRKAAGDVAREKGSDIVIVDSAAGTGCPVIASIQGSDMVVAVTEPTPSALHDLKRVLYIADHFGIPKSIVINKSDLDRGFREKTEAFARKSSIPVIGRVPYKKSVVESTVKMMPAAVLGREFEEMFTRIAEEIESILGKPV